MISKRNFYNITNEDKIFVREILSYVPESYLSDKQIRQLIQDYHDSHDIKIRDKIFFNYIKQILSIANTLVGNGPPLRDLIIAGTFGAYDAIDMFNTSKDTKFVTYFFIAVKRSMQELIEQWNTIVRLPKHIRTANRNLMKYLKTNRLSFGDVLQSAQHREEVSKLTYVSSILENPGRFASVSTDELPEGFLHHSGANTVNNQAEDRFEEESLSKDVERLVNSLPPLEAVIVKLRLGLGPAKEPSSFYKIGRKIGLPSEETQSLYDKAINKLKTRSDLLIKYIS